MLIPALLTAISIRPRQPLLRRTFDRRPRAGDIGSSGDPRTGYSAKSSGSLLFIARARPEVDDHVRAFLCKAISDCPTDPAGRSGDDGHAIFEFILCSSRFSVQAVFQNRPAYETPPQERSSGLVILGRPGSL